MLKKLSKHGHSLALVIDKPVLELLNIDENTQLQISTDGKGLYVLPVPLIAEEQFDTSLARANQRFGRMLKRLAE